MEQTREGFRDVNSKVDAILHSDVAKLRSETMSELAIVKTDMVLLKFKAWLIGAIAGCAPAIVGMLYTIYGHHP